MTLPLWLTGLSLLVLLILFLFGTRWVSRRVDHLQQSYWELRYEYTELRARVTALEQKTGLSEPTPPPTPHPGGPGSADVSGFIPLSSLKK